MNEAVAEIRRGPRIAHPLVSAVQFAHLTNTEGGATMNVHTNQIAEPGDKVYFVGGEPDRHGNRVPTHYENGALSPLDVIRHKNRLASASRGNPRMHLGSWKDEKTEIDASGGYADANAAIAHMKARNEKALWDMGSMQEVRNSEYRP